MGAGVPGNRCPFLFAAPMLTGKAYHDMRPILRDSASRFLRMRLYLLRDRNLPFDLILRRTVRSVSKDGPLVLCAPPLLQDAAGAVPQDEGEVLKSFLSVVIPVEDPGPERRRPVDSARDTVGFPVPARATLGRDDDGETGEGRQAGRRYQPIQAQPSRPAWSLTCLPAQPSRNALR